MNIFEANKIHFIGVGGAGMSALAQFLNHSEKNVSGSDMSASPVIDSLNNDGIEVFIGHKADNLSKYADLVVSSLAIPLHNEEYERAGELNIPKMTYPEAVGSLVSNYNLITVSGTHGKTTVTGLIAAGLLAAETDPSVIVGAPLDDLGGSNFRVGKKRGNLVLEACEYKRAFLNYKPQMALINNIEPEHLDYFKDEDDYVSAFSEFVGQMDDNAVLIANMDDEAVSRVAAQAKCKVIGFGMKDSNMYALDGNKVLENGHEVGEFDLVIPGEHNLMNALGAYAVLKELGVESGVILQAFKIFTGAWRRFEFKGENQGVMYYDDYAHHPTEIQATLKGAREKFPNANIRVIFQPHQHSRTKMFYEQFLKSFDDADEVIVPDIFETREGEVAVSAEEFADDISKGKFIDGFSKTAQYIKETQQPGDLIITMGAGDVYKVLELLKPF